jgi:hypothetical protein
MLELSKYVEKYADVVYRLCNLGTHDFVLGISSLANRFRNF